MADGVDNPWNAANEPEQNPVSESLKKNSKSEQESKPQPKPKPKPKKAKPKIHSSPTSSNISKVKHTQSKTKTEPKIEIVNHNKQDKSKFLPIVMGVFLVLVVVLGIYAYINKTTTVFAYVDNEKITKEDVVERAKLYYSNEAVITPQEEIVRQLINEELLLSEAKKEGIIVSGKEADDFILKLKQEYGDNYDIELKKQGLSESDLKDFYRDQAKITKLLEKAIPILIQVSEKEAKDYYDKNKEKFFYYKEKVHAYHLLYNSSEEANKTLDLIKNQNKTFEELASTSKDRTYDLGYFKTGVMVKPFEDFVFNNSINHIGIVETQFGWHVVKVLNKTGEGYESFEERKQNIIDLLEQEKRTKGTTLYFNKIFSEHKIKFKEISCLNYFAIKNNSVLSVTSNECIDCKNTFGVLQSSLFFFNQESYKKLVQVNINENPLVLTTCYEDVKFNNQPLYLCTSNNKATMSTNKTALEDFVKAC